MTDDTRQRIDESVRAIGEAIRKATDGKTSASPRVGVVLGTGLGSLSSAMSIDASISYEDIPHFVTSTAESHDGVLEFGSLSGHGVVVMKGRLHYYEGYSMRDVTFPIRVMRALGVETLIVTNAVGGMNPTFAKGEVFLTLDHINFMGDNPLIGPNDDSMGPRFPDMSEPYDLELARRVEQFAMEEKIALRKGVFVAVAGPNLETRAEYRFLRAMGGDVVGMSLIPENLVAVHSGMKVCALSAITDMGLPDALEPVDIPEILRVAGEAAPKLMRLVVRLVESLDG